MDWGVSVDSTNITQHAHCPASRTLTVTGGRRSPSSSTSRLLLRHISGFSALASAARPAGNPGHPEQALRSSVAACSYAHDTA